MLNTPHTRWQGDQLHGQHPVLTPVWVDLDVLFRRPPDFVRRVIETGLDLTGQVQGRLHGRWPSVDGLWCGVADYEIFFADGRSNQVSLKDQLLPFSALRERET